MKKAKEIVSSNAIVVFRSVSSRWLFVKALIVCMLPWKDITIIKHIIHEESLCFDGFIFCSKSYCPYCVKVKDLLKKLGAKFIAVELDKESNNSQYSSYKSFHCS